MSSVAYSRTGAGEPLVLLPGIGMSRRVWDPVIPALAGQFDVIAVDLPGFGESTPLATSVEAHPRALAAPVAALLDELAVTSPHLVGNSLGGWVALELAAQRPAASVTLLSPAGLWRNHAPHYCRVSLRTSRWAARRFTRALSWAVRWSAGRLLVLGQTHGRPWVLTPDEARRTVRTMATAHGFERALAATTFCNYAPQVPVSAPVTVAFGARDWLLRPRQSRHLEALPAGRRVASLPGCGHVPMADDPAAVAALIADSVTRAVSARLPTLDAALPPGR